VRSPASEADLLGRAHALAGRTVGELAREAGIPDLEGALRNKGLVGRLVEQALGADGGTGIDFGALGVELKTIPLRRDGRPVESTFVTRIPLSRVADQEWVGSAVQTKLARVLWVPVEADRGAEAAGRRIGAAFLWSPTREEEGALRSDWDELVGLLASGQVEQVTGHIGRCLQVRPKAARGDVRTRAPEADGAYLWTVPRGFYLRARFTAGVVARGIGGAGVGREPATGRGTLP